MEGTLVVLIIFVIIGLCIAGYIAANTSHKSNIVGNSLPDFKVHGTLYNLSDTLTPFKIGKDALMELHEKGIVISQFGCNTNIEIPFAAMININAINFKEVVSENKSVIGRSAIGGLLLGDIGAIIGGISGLQTGTKTISGDLISLEFNYDGVNTILAIHDPSGVSSFLNMYKELSKTNNDNDLTQELTSEKIVLGKYKAYQKFNDDTESIICTINYDINNYIIIMQIDGRNAMVSLHMTHPDKENLIHLLSKGIDWDSKAKKNKLNADKIIDKLALYSSFHFDNKVYINETTQIEISYYCDYQNTETSYVIISSPNFNIDNTGVKLSPSIILIEIEEIQKILDTISDEYIKSFIDKHLSEQKLIDQILN